MSIIYYPKKNTGTNTGVDKLENLLDCNVSNIRNYDDLKYNTLTDKWENKFDTFEIFMNS